MSLNPRQVGIRNSVLQNCTSCVSIPHMTRAVEIATIILEQIKEGTTSNVGRTISGRHAMLCWGVRKLNAVSENEQWEGGLEFVVSGVKYSGLVRVLLAWDDTYTIKLNNDTTRTNIYFDQLTEVIDALVEIGE